MIPPAVPAGRIALAVEYDGGGYHGWQTQTGLASVQQVLEAALGRLAGEPVAVYAAGRTDAGVHARGQVVHFDTAARRSERAWTLGTNAHLPDDIAVRWARNVEPHFHARYSAVSRTYRYAILSSPARSALLAGRVLLVHQALDLAAMRDGAAALVGEHDFSAFRSSECQSHSTVRRLSALEIRERGGRVDIEITANAFLHHMVRNIVGLLLAIGRQRVGPERARQQLESRQRSTGEATAPAHGLYLMRVEYPPAFGLPAE